MCTLLIWKHEHPIFGLVAAANRDEFFDRPATGAQVLAREPRVVGGRDEVAGGSWFAFNEHGVLVALTNRRSDTDPDPARRSRGLLVAELARTRTLTEALDGAEHVDPASYNPFVLLIADASRAFAVHCADDVLQTMEIGDGAHAITNWDIDAAVPAKAAHALEVARTISLRGEVDCAQDAAMLHVALGDHAGTNADRALCVHRNGYGTRSSTIAFVSSERGRSRLFHAEGPPCTSTIVDVSALLRDETNARAAKS